jgi:hypothetical protein
MCNLGKDIFPVFKRLRSFLYSLSMALWHRYKNSMHNHQGYICLDWRWDAYILS